MKWSFQIGSAFGIPIRVHVTFLLLLAVLTMGYQGGRFLIYPDWLLLVVLLFGSVIVHELSHSLMAVRRGIRVHSITLLPIGGVAQMAAMPEDPADEVQIAVAGPAASYALAGAIAAVAFLLNHTDGLFQFPSLKDTQIPPGEFLTVIFSRLFWANVMLGTLNLVPAFPMDGGRVLRGLLAQKVGLVKATHTAVACGQAFAVLLYCIGALYYHQVGYSFILLAVFIYIGARNEEEEVEFRSEIAYVPARDAMLTRFDSLSPRMTIHESLDVLRHSQQEEFPVLDAGKLAGMVSKNAVLGALSEMPREALVGEIMSRDFIHSAADTPLGKVFRQMEERDKDVVPILEDGKLVGLLSYDQIGRYHSLSAKKREAESKA